MHTFPASPIRRRAFSLIELVIVLNLIAVLVAVSVPIMRAARARSRENACKSNMQVVAMALKRYKADNKAYPTHLTDLYPDYVASLDTFICPSDPRGKQQHLSSQRDTFGLNLFYAKREPLESGEEIICGCPFHKQGLVQYLDGHIAQGDFQTATLKSPVKALLLRRNETAASSVTSETTLLAGDTVLTEEGGSALIQFSEGSKVTLGSNTKVTIKASMPAEQPNKFVRILGMFLNNPSGSDAVVDCDVAHGFYTGGGGRFEVHTPTLMGGVRGTKFRVVLSQTNLASEVVWESTLSVTEGVVEVKGNNKTEKVKRGEKKTHRASKKKKKKSNNGGGQGNGGGDDDDDD